MRSCLVNSEFDHSVVQKLSRMALKNVEVESRIRPIFKQVFFQVFDGLRHRRDIEVVFWCVDLVCHALV